MLCLLFEQAGEVYVVLTRRSSQLPEHGGQVAFPGGRLLLGEAPLEGALREAEEEIGIDRASVEVIGELTPLRALGQSALVSCFVACTTSPGPDGPHFVVDVREVDRVFWVPLAELAADNVYHEELWPSGPGYGQAGGAAGQAGGAAGQGGTWRAVPFFYVAGEVVWGATGRLLEELLEVVLLAGKGPPGPAGEREPPMTRPGYTERA
ncbi:MAG: NUDIX hydrolase [Acidimicrobiales bacterium]